MPGLLTVTLICANDLEAKKMIPIKVTITALEIIRNVARIVVQVDVFIMLY